MINLNKSFLEFCYNFISLTHLNELLNTSNNKKSDKEEGPILMSKLIVVSKYEEERKEIEK